MNKTGKPSTCYSYNPKMGQAYPVKGYKDGGMVTKPDDTKNKPRSKQSTGKKALPQPPARTGRSTDSMRYTGIRENDDGTWSDTYRDMNTLEEWLYHHGTPPSPNGKKT